MSNYKLTNDTKEEIKKMKGKLSGYKTAKQFDVSTTLVYRLWMEKKYPCGLSISVLKKMIPVFVENRLKVNLNEKEIELVKDMYEDVSNE